MFIQVCGAAREVTGSSYVVGVGDTRFLVDCGMFQGGDKEFMQNFEPFCFEPRAVDFVVLTHAHIDHSGRLPRLVKAGFDGPIYATPATCDLAEIMLLDSAYIQEMESEWRTRKAERAGRGAVEPLYVTEDAQKTIRLLKPVEYSKPTQVAPGVTMTFHDAGHILGSAFLALELDDAGRKEQVLFSGDVGQPRRPIVRDPESIVYTDYLVMESTYGDRLHDKSGSPLDQLTAILKDAKRTGGNVVIPAFAVGRTQELLYYVREILEKESLEMPVYVDSPLATRATEVYRKHPEVFDEEAWKIVHEPGGIFDFRQLHYTASAEESKAINRVKGAIIISASGMADAGRIRHHLKHNIWRPEAHVVIVGYQAPGTLGRRLLEGAQTVRLFGEDVAVKAHIHDLDSMSAHADQAQLLEWASNFKPPKLTIITHGEPESALAFQKVVEEKLGFKALVPARGQIIELDGIATKK